MKRIMCSLLSIFLFGSCILQCASDFHEKEVLVFENVDLGVEVITPDVMACNQELNEFILAQAHNKRNRLIEEYLAWNRDNDQKLSYAKEFQDRLNNIEEKRSYEQKEILRSIVLTRAYRSFNNYNNAVCRDLQSSSCFCACCCYAKPHLYYDQEDVNLYCCWPHPAPTDATTALHIRNEKEKLELNVKRLNALSEERIKKLAEEGITFLPVTAQVVTDRD